MLCVVVKWHFVVFCLHECRARKLIEFLPVTVESFQLVKCGVQVIVITALFLCVS